ncbi:MAG TPA: hypothetical protein VEB20_05110 [Azospirillaceae bacterium]|nr:hypothetical protein [Azospirillaceae bacterium]
MSTRTTSSTVSFALPFRLSSLDETLPAGNYTVETDEELVEGVSFPAYRRTLTVMLVPDGPGRTGARVVPVDPEELREALDAELRSRAGAAFPTVAPAQRAQGGQA